MKRSILWLTLVSLLLLGCEFGRTPQSNVAAATPVPPTNAAADGVTPTGAGETSGDEVAVPPTTTPAPPAETATPEATATPADPLASVDPTGQEIAFWYPVTDTRGSALGELAEAFNAENEWGITVRAVYTATDGALPEGVGEQLGTDAAPALLLAEGSEAATFRAADGLVDLTPFIESSTWGLDAAAREDFDPAAINSGFDETFGEQLGFPLGRSVEALLVNTDLLDTLGADEPPASWEELEELACAASEQEATGLLLTPDARTVVAILESRGGSLLNDAGSAYTLDSPTAIETLTFLQTLFEQGCAALAPSLEQARETFAAGTVLFLAAPSSEAPATRAAVEAGFGGEWVLAPLPHSTSEPVSLAYGPTLSVAATTPEQQLAAWLFIRWLGEAPQQARWAEATGDFPVRTSAADEMEDFLGDNPAYEAGLPLLATGQSEPTVAGYGLVRLLLTDGMLQILAGADVAETLGDLTEDANDLLDRGQS